MYVCVFVGLDMCGGRKIFCRSQFSPSSMWVLGFELGSLGLAASFILH